MDRRFAARLRAVVPRVAARVASAVLVTSGVAAAPPPPASVGPGAPAPLVETADAFGPFRFGMAVEDALAIAPGFDWFEDRDPGYGRKRVVTAEGGWHLGGRIFDVTLAPGYHGDYELELRHTRDGDVADACRDAVVALATEFERRFGELTGPALQPAVPGRISVQRTSEGHPFVTVEPGVASAPPGPAAELFDVGEDSSVAMLPGGGDLPGAASWYTRREPTRAQPWRVTVDGRFARDEDGAPPTCKVVGKLAREGEVPREVWLDVARTPIAHAPSAAVLHHSLDAFLQPRAKSRARDLAELSAAGVEVILDCAVRRDTGALSDCRTADVDRGGRRVAVPLAPLENVAWQRARHLRFDVQAIDPRDPARLRAKVPMRVAPGDRLALGPVPSTLRPLRDIAWAQRPTGADLERAYPRDALGDGIEAVVRASCRLQPDLTAVCIDAVVTPAGDAENTHAFALAAYEVLAKFRARDVLRDGTTPAAGEWFTGSVTFRLGD